MTKRSNNWDSDNEQEEFDNERTSHRNRRLNNKWRDKRKFNQDTYDEDDVDYEEED